MSAETIEPPTLPAFPSAMHLAAITSPGRLNALRSTNLLDTPAEEPFDRLTLVCRVLCVPVSLVSLVDANRQFFMSQQGLPAPWAEKRETPLSHSFCQHVVVRREPLVVEDARNNPLVCENLAVPDLGVAAYLGVPLTTPEGHVLGSLCAIDTKPRIWTDDDLLTLQDVAHAVMGEVTLRAEIVRRRESEAQLTLLSEELTHRIKNIFAVTGSLVALSANAGGSTDEVIAAVRRRLGALAKAHDYVTPRLAGALVEQTSNLTGLLEALLAAYPQDQIKIGKCEQKVGAKAASALALIFHETATNAIKYGALSTSVGLISIACTKEGDAVTISWQETGGPPVQDHPERRGFGSVLAERIAGSQLNAVLEREWQKAGLRLTLRVPYERMLD